MTNSLRLTVLALAVVAAAMVTAPYAAAQHETAADALRLLTSSSLADQAWGAWIAGRDRFPDLIPDVQHVAVAYRDTTIFPNALVTTVAIDALIEMNARVEADWAASFLPGRPTQAMILLSRVGPAADSALVRILQERRGLTWFAAADVLLQRRPAANGFAATLLTHLEIRGIVFVAPAPGQRYGESDGIGAGSVTDGMARRAADFPPIAFYHLDDAPRPGAVVLAPGPMPIYYVRELLTDRNEGTTMLDIGGPSASQRLEYVYALLGPSGAIRLKGLNTETIVWATQAALDAEVARYEKQLESQYASLVSELQRRQLVTGADATSLPPPTFKVEIMRK